MKIVMKKLMIKILILIILCEVHIYNSMYPPNSYVENEAKDSDYYSYILRFTIESEDIKIKNS